LESNSSNYDWDEGLKNAKKVLKDTKQGKKVRKNSHLSTINPTADWTCGNCDKCYSKTGWGGERSIKLLIKLHKKKCNN
jgi:hypothetical protein